MTEENNEMNEEQAELILRDIQEQKQKNHLIIRDKIIAKIVFGRAKSRSKISVLKDLLVDDDEGESF